MYCECDNNSLRLRLALRLHYAWVCKINAIKICLRKQKALPCGVLPNGRVFQIHKIIKLIIKMYLPTMLVVKMYQPFSKNQPSFYSRYYAKACNEWRDPSPHLGASAIQLQRNITAVVSSWPHCAQFDRREKGLKLAS